MNLSRSRHGAIALAVASIVALTAGVPFLAQAGTGDAAGAALTNFMPHGMCYLWNPQLMVLQIGSDAAIAVAYFSIPVLLIYFVRKRPDIPFGRVLWMFGGFIIACGSTHVLDIWTIWHPAYWLSGVVKAVTATASLATAAMLVPLIPKALNYISPADLLQHSTRHLRFFANASEALTAPRSQQELLDAVLDIVVPELADCAVINLVEDSRLRTRSVRARPEFAGVAAGLVGATYAQLDGTSASALSIRTGKTQIVKAPTEAYLRGIVDEPYLGIFRQLAPRTALAVPLIFEDGAHGTFLAIRSGKRSRRFNETEIVLFETLARRTVAAIESLENVERLAHAALHDPLTGLANRVLLANDVDAALVRYREREGYFAAVLYLDLDRFKLVNDSLGHVVGDALLVAIARRLESSVRPGDTFARVSGDEFVMLLCDIHSPAEAERIADRILAQLAEPFAIDGHEIFATGSIGLAFASMENLNFEELVRDADIAMYRAKTLGKGRCVTFEPAMRNAARLRLALDAELRRALDRGELEVFYQPIVALESGKTEGFEALVRWRHPSRGLLSPLEFIPIAEETGSIVGLGALVLRMACAQTRRWQAASPRNAALSINVNVSPKQLREPDYVHSVRAVLRETGCAPASLHLEITESVLVEDRASLAASLGELRSLGIRIDIDDFGTGYSSLAYLHAFPIDVLKIDRSFVSGSGSGIANPEIVTTILALAKKLDLDVIAEGVETREQAANLFALGCTRAQGYVFSKPMNVAAASSYLNLT
ncbi:MAG: hypothetical protein NVS3B16_25300 [Vulcanimicrobiaceae bacterium]